MKVKVREVKIWHKPGARPSLFFTVLMDPPVEGAVDSLLGGLPHPEDAATSGPMGDLLRQVIPTIEALQAAQQQAPKGLVIRNGLLEFVTPESQVILIPIDTVCYLELGTPYEINR